MSAVSGFTTNENLIRQIKDLSGAMSEQDLILFTFSFYYKWISNFFGLL